MSRSGGFEETVSDLSIRANMRGRKGNDLKSDEIFSKEVLSKFQCVQILVTWLHHLYPKTNFRNYPPCHYSGYVDVVEVLYPFNGRWMEGQIKISFPDIKTGGRS